MTVKFDNTDALSLIMAEGSSGMRQRVTRAAVRLLAAGGKEAVTTRAVCASAEIQPPTIYRIFGDMQGLLDAAAHATLAEYVRGKTTQPISDSPIDDLRRGWDVHVAFGLANPAAYIHLYGDPRTSNETIAVQEGHAQLQKLLGRIAEAGQLRVDVDHAARIVGAAGTGVTLTLIGMPDERRDVRLSGSVRDAVIAAIADENIPPETSHEDRTATRAIGLRAVLQETSSVFSEAELALMIEWLDRLSGRAGPLCSVSSVHES